MELDLRDFSTGALRKELDRRAEDRPRNAADPQPGDMPMCNQAMRQSARAIVQERIRRLNEQAAGLDILLNSIPANLPQEADEALWRLVLSAKE